MKWLWDTWLVGFRMILRIAISIPPILAVWWLLARKLGPPYRELLFYLEKISSTLERIERKLELTRKGN